MADAPPATHAAAPSGHKLAGLPWWVWAAGAGAIALGYWYFSSQGSSSSSSSGSGTTTTSSSSAAPGMGWDQFLLSLHDQQASPGVSTAAPAKGSERTWLERKTGSKHPWTYLHHHHESIKVGPNGSRTIVHRKAKPKPKHHKAVHHKARRQRVTGPPTRG